jgi:hypothetical protein
MGDRLRLRTDSGIVGRGIALNTEVRNGLCEPGRLAPSPLKNEILLSSD